MEKEEFDDIDEMDLIKQREVIIRDFLPEFYKASNNKEADVVILTDVAFGDNPMETEFLGLAVKYACSKGKEVRVIPMKVKED